MAATKRPKLSLCSLAIETTRKCNMTCEHCMRGDPQNKNLMPTAVDFLFERLDRVYDITPTGGEPTMNPDALIHIRKAITKHNVSVGGVYVVTNGLEVTDVFIKNFMDLLLATDMDEDSCGIAISQDMFHDNISYENRRKLSLFGCFRPDDKKTDWTRVPPMAIGRAASENCPVETRAPYKSDPFYSVEIDEDGNVTIDDTTLALTVDGDLLAGCDYAYADTDAIKLCNVLDPHWFEELTAKVQAAIVN